MMNLDLIKEINKVERIASSSKIKRLLNNPYKYIFAIVFRQFIYPKKKKERITYATLFFGKKMKIALPASTDIFLTGGKSHNSEIRLARFIILNLRGNDHFLDVGAHYGYFTMIASEIVGNNGKVVAFEPSDRSYKLLNENRKTLNNTVTFQKAVSDSNDNLIFYEFPNLHSEYNSSDISQFENESWFNNSKPAKTTVSATTIDEVTKDGTFSPRIIKIDVEGGEYKVIQGGITYLQKNSPYIVMEYLEPKRHNESHKKALELLLSLSYKSNIIVQNGQIEPIKDVDTYLTNNHLESDNIVFQKIATAKNY
jgi:FkbM family methyltransferase